MAKVCILTIHHVPNYGAVYQALALKHNITKLGHQCDVIDYRPQTAVKRYSHRNALGIPSLSKLTRNRRFEHFISRRVLNTNSRNPAATSEELQKQISKYDVVVCGSDQIWNADSFRGIDPNFFLAEMHLPSTKKVAYAPSVGNSRLEQYEAKAGEVTKWLNEFEHIGVRDNSTLAFVRAKSDRTAVRVCDPTLLPFSREVLFDGEPADEQNYGIVYGNLPRHYSKSIASLLRSTGSKLVAIGHRCRLAEKQYATATPESFLDRFHHARFVITTFFHGVQLSLLGDKPFIAITPDHKKAKISDCLQMYDLQHRMIQSPESLDVDSLKICGDEIRRVKLQRISHAEESLTYLEAAVA